MRTILFAIALATMPGVFVGQAASSLDTSTTVATSGTGELTLVPDRVVVVFGVTTQDSRAGGAAARNSVLVKRVVDSLAALRGSGDTVQLIAVSVRPQENYQQGTIRGYVASGQIRVSLQRLDQLAHTIDAAFAAGATGIDGVTFHSDREDSAQQDALARAFAQAASSAQTLAVAAGVKLGALLRVSTDPYGRIPFGDGSMRLSGGIVTGYGQMPIIPQDIRVTASVHVTWRLERK